MFFIGDIHTKSSYGHVGVLDDLILCGCRCAFCCMFQYSLCHGLDIGTCDIVHWSATPRFILQSPTVADSRPAWRQTPTVARVFILQLATVASASGRLSSAVADCSFQSSTMLNFQCSRQQSLALSIQSAGHNSIYKVTAHADLKNTSCYQTSKITTLCMPPPPWLQKPQKQKVELREKQRRKDWKRW